MAGTSDAALDHEIDTLTLLGEQLITGIISNEPTETIMNLIDSDAPLWYQNEAEGISCLHAAAYRQDTELVKLLIERGAVWNAGELKFIISTQAH